MNIDQYNYNQIKQIFASNLIPYLLGALMQGRPEPPVQEGLDVIANALIERFGCDADVINKHKEKCYKEMKTKHDIQKATPWN